jgi:3-oxoadipate enol-lactonase
MKVTTSDGVGLAVRVDGPAQGAPLLFLNSLGCDLSMWAPQVGALAETHQIIRFDTRGHGASDAPDGDYTLERLGRDALSVLDGLGVARAHICGLSMGGVIAQWLAVEAPTRVGSLILANTAARVGTVEAWQARLDTVLREGMAAIAETVLGRFFTDSVRAAEPALVADFRRILLATPPQGYAGCCAALRDADLRASMRLIARPTLVIGGRFDVSTPLAEAEALAAGIAGAGLRVLETAHLSNVEAPEPFAEAVRRHLEAA